MAWSGLGSAVKIILDQITEASSVLGTLSVLGYLSCISILHITTPALFSVQAFNVSIPTTITTQGFPQINTAVDPDGSVTLESVPDVLSSLLSIRNTPMAGLVNGSLYEVPNADDGEATVSAIAFNISCGYLSASHTGTSNGTANMTVWEITIDHLVEGLPVYDTVPNAIMFIGANIWNDNTVLLYSTSPIVDSQGNTGMAVNLDPPMVLVSELYFFQCSKTTVPQNSTVDCNTKQSMLLAPDIHKNQSLWRDDTLRSAQEVSEPAFDPDMSESDWWSRILASIILLVPKSTIPSSIINFFVLPELEFSLADIFVIETLNLSTYSDLSGTAPPAKLHDLENALSSLVASIFWMVGHLQPGTLDLAFEAAIAKYYNTNSSDPLFNPYTPPVLSVGSAVVSVPTPAARLDSSIVAISVGLATSILLVTLALPHLREPPGRKPPVSGTGLLHVIWLWRNRPEIQDLVPQVDEPTDRNLREAGMVKVALIDTEAYKNGEEFIRI
ncbi:hypothetical protein MSAN_00834400 [Mycena sanguinolenta]|uniref:Uncharacterized protein n=1 Tax=Mycena sanguinolenta TaxID=230812 RepID=A0A8H7DDM4_9AGAR|nr:hypothetical protein MSAN_00834400 [Mycena sanguinolenta]